MGLPPYVHPAPEGTRLDIFVQPRAAREGLAGIHGDALKLKVRAPAQDDKANQAVLALLAALLDVPVSRLTISSGRTSRSKRVLIAEADPGGVAARLGAAAP